jgi:hypothetical protein
MSGLRCDNVCDDLRAVVENLNLSAQFINNVQFLVLCKILCRLSVCCDFVIFWVKRVISEPESEPDIAGTRIYGYCFFKTVIG